VRSQHPEWPAALSTVTSIRAVIANTAVDIDPQNPGLAGMLGRGRIDIGAAVEAGPVAPGPGDLNNDGHVNVPDLLAVLLNWSMVHSSADMDGTGRVDVGDLIIVIANWH